MYSRVAATATAADTWTRRPVIRGIHSSTLRLNVSTFCGKRWVVSVIQ